MARINEPSITSMPIPAPMIVGQEVPELGNDGAGVVPTTVVLVPVAGVAVEVPQLQLVLLVHDGLRQKPW